MLPASFQVPGAVVLLAIGLLACFAGYRLFRVILAIYGFLLGALVASSLAGSTEGLQLALIALAGGVIGALIMMLAYFVGVAIVGAGLGALVANAIWAPSGNDPHALVVIAFSIAGALAALAVQRYVIILGTAFGGAWTALVGGLALTGDRAVAAGREAVWTVYPLDPAPGEPWVLGVWLVLGTVGAAVQLGALGSRRR